MVDSERLGSRVGARYGTFSWKFNEKVDLLGGKDFTKIWQKIGKAEKNPAMRMGEKSGKFYGNKWNWRRRRKSLVEISYKNRKNVSWKKMV